MFDKYNIFLTASVGGKLRDESIRNKVVFLLENIIRKHEADKNFIADESL